MMPSAQKKQTTVSQNGSVTTTTVTTTAPVATPRFTQAELGSQGLARSIDRKMNEMNQEKSKIVSRELDQVLARTVREVSQDRSFGSSDNVNEFPELVLRILEKHDIDLGSVTRMIHIPGANYFSIVQPVGEEKKYTSFSLEEKISEPAEELPVDDIEPQPEEVVGSVQEDLVSEIVPQETPSVSTTNTLGTILPVVTESATQTPETDTIVPPEIISPVATEIQPVNDLVDSSAEAVPAALPVVETINSRDVLEKARSASAREFEDYYGNKYRDRPSGTFNQLFGNNQSIQESRFKTITDYQTAKKNFFAEIAQSNPSLKTVLETVRQEQVILSELLSYKKHNAFVKLAFMFHIPVSNTLETRNRIIGTTTIAATPTISDRLGIRTLLVHDPDWKKIFTNTDVQLPVRTKKEFVIQIPKNEQDSSLSQSVQKVEKKFNKKKIFNALHTILAKEWNINQPKTVSKSEQIEPVLIETVNNSPTQAGITSIETVHTEPIVFQPAPVSDSLNTKQAPEHLFT